jgi:hypothetical protein
MRGLDFAVVAAGPLNNPALWKVLIFVGATLVLTILRKIAETREKAIRSDTASKTPQPPPPKRDNPRDNQKDNPFRNEIEAFLEEVGKRRATNERPVRPPGERGPGEAVVARTLPTPKVEPARKPVTLRPAAANERAKPEPAKTVVLAGGPPVRPGAEIAARKAPGSEDLGKQIRTHLATYLDPTRMASQTRSDLGNAVERTVRQHLGDTVTAGVSQMEQAPEPQEIAIVPLLRNPSGVRAAIVVNEILGPPKGLRRRR